MQQEWAVSVSQLNEYVRRLMAGDKFLSHLHVSGEVSGVKYTTPGHIYFTLKDDKARLQCAMFRQYAYDLQFRLQDGMHVIVHGNASVFVRDGSYQLYAESIEKQGIGDLYRQFLELKDRLEAEGLFDNAIKKPFPLLPQCVGIATSETGAVLHDILRVGWSRFPNMRFIFAPCSVQGSDAAQEIVSAIEQLNQCKLCDVILCGRGGGSIEDLWPFNEERVARAIRASDIPVVSCVGHETDLTIADFAADARAATPSAAAEMAIPEYAMLRQMIATQKHHLSVCTAQRIKDARNLLKTLSSSYVFAKPREAWVKPRSSELEKLRLRLDSAYHKKISDARNQLILQKKALSVLRPGAPLQKGYALISQNGIILQSIHQVHLDQDVSIRMQDGQITAKPTSLAERSIWEYGQNNDDI